MKAGSDLKGAAGQPAPGGHKPSSSVSQRVAPPILSGGLNRPSSASQRLPASAISAGGNVSGQIVTDPYSCSVCGKKLGKEGVLSGAGRIVDGHLVCAQCLSKKEDRPQGRKNIWIYIAPALVALAVAAVFIPGPALFIAIMLGLLAVLVGAIGFDLTGMVRGGLVVGGLVTLIGGFVLLNVMKNRKAGAATVTLLQEKVKPVNRQLEASDYSGAAHECAVLEAWVRQNIQDHHALEEAQKTLAETHKHLDEYLRQNYSLVTEEDWSLLKSVLNGSDKTKDGVPRIHRAHQQGNKVSLELVMASAPDRASVYAEAKDIVLNVFDRCRVPEVELKVLVGPSAESLRPLVTFRVDWNSRQDVRRGSDLEHIFGPIPGLR